MSVLVTNKLLVANKLLAANKVQQANNLQPSNVLPTQATPTFSPVAGTYTGTQSVTITSAGADTIYFTTDGSTPTTSSTVYSGPVSVAVSETLKALAVKAGFNNSAIGSAAYVINAAPPLFIASIATIDTSDFFQGGTNSVTGQPGGANSINTTGATLLVAFIRTGATNSVITFTDTGNNIWNFGPLSALNFSRSVLAWVSNPTTSTTHQFTVHGNTNVTAAEVYAFSSVAGTWTMDTHAESTSGNTAPIITNSITPSGVNEIVVAGCASNSGLTSATVNNGFNGGQGVPAGSALCQRLDGGAEVGGSAYLIDSTTSLINATFLPTPGTAGDWGWAIASFSRS
jgi:Chitobiase/beta-hexosaminidase C-terminal domain